MVEKKEEKEVKQYQLVEVTTQTGLAIQTPEGKLLTSEQAIVDILNYVKEIKEEIGN